MLYDFKELKFFHDESGLIGVVHHFMFYFRFSFHYLILFCASPLFVSIHHIALTVYRFLSLFWC
jgi:hypothetical protein